MHGDTAIKYPVSWTLVCVHTTFICTQIHHGFFLFLFPFSRCFRPHCWAHDKRSRRNSLLWCPWCPRKWWWDTCQSINLQCRITWHILSIGTSSALAPELELFVGLSSSAVWKMELKEVKVSARSTEGGDERDGIIKADGGTEGRTERDGPTWGWCWGSRSRGQCSYQPPHQYSCYHPSPRDIPVQAQHFFRCESLPQLTLGWKLFVLDAIGPF